MANVRKIEAIKKSTSIKKLRVAAYARVSTENNDQLLSLKTQIDHYEKYIKSHPAYDYAGLYYDEGLSGTKIEKRDGLLKLIKDCEDKKIDRIITKSISRLSRNTTNTLEIVRKLSALRISIYFEKENIDTLTMDSELMLSILSSIAESESTSIAANIKWSNENRFKNGTYKIAVAAYGYKCIDGQLYPDEQEAPIVKEIFKMALEGKGVTAIAKSLNSRNIKPRKAKKWDAACVYAILKNEKYTGDSLFQKYYTDSTFTERVNRGEKNKYYVTNHHTPLITHEEYELANTIIKTRSYAKNGEIRKSNRYPFSGKIICGQCGHKYIRTSETRKGVCKVKWACKNHINNTNECSNLPETDEDLKIAFLRVMKKLKIGRKKILDPFIKNLRKYDTSSINKIINDIDKKVCSYELNLEKVSSLFESGHLNSNQFQEESSRLKNEIEKLNTERYECLGSLENIRTHLNEAKKLSNFLANDKSIEDFDEEIFSDYVDSIVVVKRNTYIFKMKCGLKLQEEINNGK